MRVQQFLNQRQVNTAEDIGMQMQLFAYLVAKHYSISLTEVYQMSAEIFRQSLVWAMAIEGEQAKAMEKERVSSSSGSNDIVTFDYSFLNLEEES